MTATNHPDHPVLAPTQQVERIQIVDILRGFALFGILLVNMALFSRPFQSILFPADPSMPWYDRAAEWLIHTLAEGKFYAMFSLLFGLGMVLLMERIQARGGRFVPLYVRRLLALLLIGLVHAFLIWPGDILILYALVGFPLILFRKARPRTLLIWAVILIAIPLLLTAASTGTDRLGTRRARRSRADRSGLCPDRSPLPPGHRPRQSRSIPTGTSWKSRPSASTTTGAWGSPRSLCWGSTCWRCS